MKISKIEYVILEEPKQYYDVVNVSDTHNFLIQTSSGYIVSHNCDEVSFQPNQDIEKQKSKAKQLISTADARMQSRFMKGEKLPTLHILASSKRTEQSFLESYIDMKKKNESKTTLIIDEPQWVIRTDKDSPQKFNVAVGNKFLNSELLPLNITNEELQIYRNRGFNILKVPMGYYESFKDDLDIALTDIAGVSTSNSSRYISGERWSKCINKKAYNPFTKDIIEVGNSAEDIAQYYDFFDLTKIDSELKSRPLYVHLDMSVSGDKTGIAGVWIIGKKDKVEEGRPASKDLRYRLAFNTSIKAPKGHQISFEKNRQFIFWLREQGFNIKGVSTDTFQSYDTGQTLKVKGFNYDIISVDRVDKDRICKPYQYFRTTIYDERIEIYETALLTEEIIGLKRDSNGKIDHDITGINCLVENTKIKLVDGRNIEIKDLVKEFNEGKQNFVYTFNEVSQKIEPKLIENAFKSGTTSKLVRITLDNGEKIECTPEHRFMLRDGSYIEAQFLMPYDSLMPLYTKESSKGLAEYRLYYEPMTDEWHYEHRQFAWKNHKIKSIEFIDDVEVDVYDLTIKDNHNFAVSAGVIVHNSKDSADAVCGATYNASQHAEEFAFDFGESLDTIAKTNIVNSNIRQQITTDFEAELKLLDPLAKFNEKEKQKEKEITTSNTQNSQTHQSTIPEPKEVPNAYLYDGIIVW